MSFTRPELLLLAIPWVALWLGFARLQRRSCEWIWERVDERFRDRFTLYRPTTLGRRLAALLVLGLLLVVAAAGPALRGETEVRDLGGRLVVLLDGSASMLADDLVDGAGGQQRRFDRGRAIAAELATELEGSEFALVVFSGVASLQLPLTADPATIAESLAAASFHTFYRSSGSSFSAALDAVLHFVEPGRADLQAILLSDGEQPFAESFEEPLAALAERRVPVHAVAIGSRQGQSRLIYDFRDVVAGKEEKRVLREYTTRREDRHLRRIARRTGGHFTVAEGGETARIAAAVRRRIERSESVRTEGRRELGALPLALFLAGFLFEALVWGRRRRPRDPAFDLDRLGKGRRPAAAAGMALLAVSATLLVACRSDTPLARASRENERGIAADALESWRAARVHYDRSRAYEIRPEIPAFNLARSVSLQGDWSEAHDLYQQALQLAPELAPAHYNDGHVLYRWGEVELDLELCELERTLELWQGALRRFATAAELSAEDDSGRELALRNHRFVNERIAEIEEACRPPEPMAGGGGADDQQASGGGGGGSEGEEGRGASGGPGEEEGEAGGEGEEESEAGGEGDEEGEAGGEGEEEGEAGGEGADESEAGGDGEEEGESGGEGDREGEAGGGPGDGGPSGGGSPLSGAELEQIEQALERIAEDRLADGRYHYRTRAEQFPREVWENPEAEIWW